MPQEGDDPLRRPLGESATSRPAEADDPRLDMFAQGPLREILARFRERLVAEASRMAGRRRVDANHLEQAYESLLSKTRETHWPTANRRRLYLIRKELSGSITPAELAELERLQAEADRHMSEVAPRPLEFLWDLREELLQRKSQRQDEGP